VSEKQQTSLKTVRKYMWWSMGAGLVRFGPGSGRGFGRATEMLSVISKTYDIRSRRAA